MIIDTGNILLIGAVLLFFSIIAGKAGFRFGVPVLLLFLGVGMLFGSDGLGIQFNNPHGAQFIGMIALSIILFSGGMDTKYTRHPRGGTDNSHYRFLYLLDYRSRIRFFCSHAD